MNRWQQRVIGCRISVNRLSLGFVLSTNNGLAGEVKVRELRFVRYADHLLVFSRLYMSTHVGRLTKVQVLRKGFK